MQHLTNYYTEHPEISPSRKPNIIHVAGKFVIMRIKSGMKLVCRTTGATSDSNIDEFHLITTDSDLTAITWVLNDLQQNASVASEILYSYGWIINKVHNIDPKETN